MTFLTNHFRLLFIILLTSLFHALGLRAQRGMLYDANELLSSSIVHEVYQDKQGFIWVSTENGLNKYDGYQFLVYKAEDGLPNDNVTCVCQDRHNNLYIGTPTGLSVMKNNRIYPVTKASKKGGLLGKGEGEPFNSYVTCFCTGPDGTLYLGTSGRGIWKVTGERTVEKAFGNIEGILFAHLLAFDHKGTLWVVTNNNGVFAVKGNKARRYDINEPTAYAALSVSKNDEIYIGLVSGGLYKADASRRGFTLVPSTKNLSVTSLMAQKDGSMLVGTNGTGLKHLNTRTGALTSTNLYSYEVDMNRVKIYSIMEDRTGNLWLALLQKGVFMRPTYSNTVRCIGRDMGPLNPIGESCVMSVFKQRNGTLWVGADQDGLYALDSNGNLLRHYAPDPSSPTSVPGTVLTMTEDNSGRLWIGSFVGGCGWLDTTTGEYHRMPFSYGRTQNIFDLQMGRNGDMWIGTLGSGVKRLNLNTGRMTEYTSNSEDSTDANSLTNNFVLEMELDPDGRYLFVGTSAGLSCIDIHTGRMDNFNGSNCLLKGQAIRAIRYRKDMGLWVGTAFGLYHISSPAEKKKDYIIKHYTTADGLADNHVAAIEVDNRRQVWVSTSRGVCSLDAKTGKFVNYYEADGIQRNEYSEGTSCRDAEGTLYFGGTMGLTFFNPQHLTHKQQKLNVALSQILVGGERIKAGDKSGFFEICDTAITEAPRFDFCHEDNTITLRFSTLSYSGLSHIAYRYSINGDDWITLPPGKNEITLSRIPPGDYRFRIEALDNGMPSKAKEFLIVIHNPWYFTPVARTIYLLLLLAAAWLYLRYLKIRNKEELELREHIHAEEMGEQKLRSFINLSHEIRTPMTLILTPLLQLMKEDNDSHRRATYDIIRRNAERILHLVNQIMDIRKIDKGQMNMLMKETDMIAFVDDVIRMFQPQTATKQMNVRLIHEGIDTLPVWIDRSQFDKVLINLMSNAVKYTPAGGDINITISQTATAADDGVLPKSSEGYVSITVFNSGEHIPEESLIRIFERFYQSPKTSTQYKTGTGVGLDLARSIVILHHGAIAARNVDGGVEFNVVLPLGGEHLKPEEIAPWSEEEHSTETLASELSMLENEVDTTTENLQPVSVSGSRRATVIIAEDDDEIRNYLMTELSTTYRTLSFSNGTDALNAILREIPQLVISDVMMPGMDGHALCTRIKSNVNTNHIPVILITAKTRDEDRLEGLETGADLYVTKPFNLDILRRNIANLIASRRLLQNKFTGKQDQSEQIDEIQMENSDEKLLNRIMAVINANLNNSDLNIEMICEEVGISRVHLHRKMKELTNQTPHDFIRNLRLKQAARLLSKKGQNITEVMYRCGFNSATSFSTMFKKMYGLSPRDYKREHEED